MAALDTKNPKGIMFLQSLHRIRRQALRSAGLALLVSVFALPVFSTPASASTASSKATLAPVAAHSGSAVTKDATTANKRRKRHAKKHGTGLLLPKKQVDAVMPAGANAMTLPAAVDLSSNDVPVGYQGSIGSCVTWAIDYALLGWYSRHDGKAGQPFNPMFTYSQIHLKNTADGGGSWPEDALNIALNQGNDTIAHYSHSTTDFNSQPSASERANAVNFKISQYQTLFSNRDGTGGGTAGATMIETALANGQPVAIGMNLRPGFTMWNSTSKVSATDDDVAGTVSGAHEIMAVAYDQTGVKIQNSWGTSYGLNGYAWLSWRVVAKDVFQAHTISGFATSANNTTTTDTTPPAMGPVNKQFPLSQQLTSTTEPVTFNWSASDASGIAAYVVYVQTDGGQYVYQSAVGATATQYTFALSIGHSYQVAVAAKDGAGNWSSYSYSVGVTPSTFDDTAFNISSPWGRYSLSDTFGGTYIASADAGAWVQKTFTGTDIALIAPKFSTAGRATVSCDGTSASVGDFYSASTVTRQIVAQCHFAQSGQHTMKIVNEGTSGRPWLGIDAFAILQ